METVEQLWKDSGYPGVARLWALVKSKAITGIKLKDVQNFIAGQEVAQLHKQAPKDAKSHHITSAGNHLDYQADLLDMSKYSRSNGGMSWCLLVEDIFNRKSFAAPLKTKSPNDVLPALNKAFESLGKPQLTLVTDNGSEFKGVVGKKLKELHIVHHTVEVGDHRSLGMIDSLCRFYKNAIHKHFTATQTTQWIDYLPGLLNSYNHTPHSSLKGMSPNDAEKRETDTRNIAHEQLVKDAKPSKFEIGDTVRVLKKKNVFSKGYEIRYSIQRFTIERIEGKNYILSNGKAHREGDLQKVQPKKDEPVVIEEGKASDIPVEEPIKDVAAVAKFDHKTENILKHKEGLSASNKREGLRERKPKNQLEHALFGQIKW
jgi:hypothetical protein